MHSRRIFAVVLRQFYLMRSSVTRLVPLFVWVTLDVILWGFMSLYLNSVMPPGFNLAVALLGAVVMWGFFVRVIQGVTMAFMEDVWSRNFLNIFSSPISITEYITGFVLAAVITSLIGLAAMLLVALIFGFSAFSYGLMFAPFLGVLFLFGIALGIFGCAVMLRYGPSAEWFVWPIPAIVSPFVGVFYPISVLPQWMQVFSSLLPPSYVFEGVRQTAADASISGQALLGGGILACGYVALAGWYFVATYRGALKTGLIARYSAENFS
jgi:ABC-2 type transport system permease protein